MNTGIFIDCFADADTDKDPEDSQSPGSPSLRSLSDQEKIWREHAYDYELRLCGHCNTTTDIKEANFFGRCGKFISI